MTNFNQLKSLDVDINSRSKFTLFMVEGDPVLILRPATQVNKAYFNRVLKSSRKFAGAVNAGAISTAVLNEARELNKELYPKEVIVGWERVVDSKNKPVEFTQADCKDFVDALPTWIFDEICTYAAQAGNFVNQIDVESAEKNSAKS